MRMTKFREWLAGDLQLREPFQPGPPAPGMPIDNFDLEDLSDALARRHLPSGPPDCPFVGEVRWGYGPGAVRVRVNSKWHCLVERLVAGLDGGPHWVLRRLFRVNTTDFRRREEVVADAVFDVVREVAAGPMDAPADSPPDLVRLAEALADEVQRKAGKVWNYLSAKRNGPHDIAVRFGIVGGGRGLVAHGAASAAMVEAAEVRVMFDPAAGFVRVLHTNIVVEGKGGDWAVQPASFDALFPPATRVRDIAEAVVTSMKFF